MVRVSLLSLVLLAACGGGSSEPRAPVVAADFLLPDVNSTSATFDTDVSPRDHIGRVSAWYYGSAT
ncbi:MAG: hypothetical protein ACYTEG_17255 [Planctomycetota bacterium]|jgi:hypothetical protein